MAVPTFATGSRTLALGVTSLVLSEAVSTAGAFSLWRDGVLQAPSGYIVNNAGSATITIAAVTDPAGEIMEWVHDQVDPLNQ